MKERRRKKKASVASGDAIPVNTEEVPSPKKMGVLKRGRSETETDIASVTTNVVIIPSNLSAKEQKKFRKDARRQARMQGRDEDALEFVIEGSQEVLIAESETPMKKKRKKEFPSIKMLLEEEKLKKQNEERLSKIRKSEEKLSEQQKARYIALDCEMVGIGSGGKQSALARVSLVNWNGEVVLDTFVQVPTRVTDFRTWVSGVKPKNIREGKAMDVKECREKVAAHLKNKVVVGHALRNDFHALMLTHPNQDTRDTAKYRPFQRLGGNKWRSRKLRDLVKENLGLSIQENGQAHDSVDDARATMELFKLVREEWEGELERKVKKASKK